MLTHLEIEKKCQELCNDWEEGLYPQEKAGIIAWVQNNFHPQVLQKYGTEEALFTFAKINVEVFGKYLAWYFPYFFTVENYPQLQAVDVKVVFVCGNKILYILQSTGELKCCAPLIDSDEVSLCINKLLIENGYADAKQKYISEYLIAVLEESSERNFSRAGQSFIAILSDAKKAYLHRSFGDCLGLILIYQSVFDLLQEQFILRYKAFRECLREDWQERLDIANFSTSMKFTHDVFDLEFTRNETLNRQLFPRLLIDRDIQELHALINSKLEEGTLEEYCALRKLQQYFNPNNPHIKQNRRLAFINFPCLYDLWCLNEFKDELRKVIDKYDEKQIRKIIYQFVDDTIDPKELKKISPLLSRELNIKSLGVLISSGWLSYKVLPVIVRGYKNPSLFPSSEIVFSVRQTLLNCLALTNRIFNKQYQIDLETMAENSPEVRFLKRLIEWTFKTTIFYDEKSFEARTIAIRDMMLDLFRTLVFARFIYIIAKYPEYQQQFQAWLDKNKSGKNIYEFIMDQYPHFVESLFLDVSLKKLTLLAEVWHQNSIARDKNKKYVGHNTWQPLISEIQIPEEIIGKTGWKVISLTTSTMLEDEGKKLKHCVVDYTSRCLYLNIHILSIRDENGDSQSTIEFEIEIQAESVTDKLKRITPRDEKKYFLKIIQHEGLDDWCSSLRCKAIESWLINKIEVGDITINFEQLENARKERLSFVSKDNLLDEGIKLLRFDPKNVDVMMAITRDYYEVFKKINWFRNRFLNFLGNLGKQISECLPVFEENSNVAMPVMFGDMGNHEYGRLFQSTLGKPKFEKEEIENLMLKSMEFKK